MSRTTTSSSMRSGPGSSKRPTASYRYRQERAAAAAGKTAGDRIRLASRKPPGIVERALQGLAQSCCQLGEQLPALGCGRATRIAEDAVRADRPLSAGPQRGHKLFGYLGSILLGGTITSSPSWETWRRIPVVSLMSDSASDSASRICSVDS